MRSLDTLTKQIIIFAAAISAVLLSLSVFIYTTQQVTAQIPQPAQPSITGNPVLVGLGVDTDFVYYAIKSPIPPVVPGIPSTGSRYLMVKVSKKDAIPRTGASKEDALAKATLASVEN
ncbi:hypothetical protein [Spirosoma jeollabukense]